MRAGSSWPLFGPGAAPPWVRASPVATLLAAPGVWEGRDEVVQSWVDGGFGAASFGSLRSVVMRANRQPAVRLLPPPPG